jgi:hypothetical protein
MLTDTRNISYVTDEGTLANSSDSQTGDGRASFDGVIPAATEVHVLLAFAHAAIKSLCIYTQSSSITVRSNAASPGGDDTIPVSAGQAFIWNTNDPASNANPFAAADVTSLYITNESVDTNTAVKIRVLLDITP